MQKFAAELASTGILGANRMAVTAPLPRSLYQRAVGYSFDAVKIFSGPQGTTQSPANRGASPKRAGG